MSLEGVLFYPLTRGCWGGGYKRLQIRGRSSPIINNLALNRDLNPGFESWFTISQCGLGQLI